MSKILYVLCQREIGGKVGEGGGGKFYLDTNNLCNIIWMVLSVKKKTKTN